MANIVFYELEQWERAHVKSCLKSHALTFIDGPMDEKNVAHAAKADVLGVFIYSRVGAAQLAKMPKLRMITTFSTGFDHIDLATCSKRGIPVANVPSYGSHTVAEHTLALMLALSKKIVQSVERTRQGNFSLEGLHTFDLADKTLGLIGFGKIGSHVAKTAKALGMHVRVYDPYADANLMELLTCKSVSLDELLNESDIISLHTPLTPGTKYIINKETIAKMKKGVILINTARGGLIDNKALVDAILSGHVGGAGLDVLEEERAIKEERQLVSPEFSGSFDLRTVVANQILYNKPNVIITPHNAFNSQEALRRIVDTSLENVEGFLAGKPVNVVNAKEIGMKKGKKK
ncbi:MAG: NAD(P)-dependent oxidoreductase [Candidatus Micrarchaeota archaeon]